MPPALRQLSIEHLSSHACVRFQAMASPCELLIAGIPADEVEQAGRLCADEAWRIEDKYSRYRRDNMVFALNTANGQPVEVDEETAGLLDFADQCYQLSDGRFDVTSGVLRRVWTFDGSERVPDAAALADCLGLVGWHRVHWQRPRLQMAAGMEIDFGGIGKEYAVDRAFLAVQQRWPQAAILVNFGGDLHAGRPPAGSEMWQVGVENPHGGQALRHIGIREAALATSGDSHRYVMHQGRRLSHILDPTTGWPVEQAPRSITVAAPTCVQAGMLSTFALLHGAEAEAFLQAQQVQFWSQR